MPDVPIAASGHLVEVLDFLGEALEPSILIGGWATFHLVGGPISKDIDLIVASPVVWDRVQETIEDLSSSRHHQGTKWRGEFDGVHVDVYLPHESQLGAKLRLRVEVLAEHTDQLGRGTWRLLTIEAHTISKLAALLDRPDSVKAAKDAEEILRLLERGVDAELACRILTAATAAPPEELPDHVARAFDLLPTRAAANKEQRRRIDRWRREWADALAAAIRPVERGRPTLS